MDYNYVNEDKVFMRRVLLSNTLFVIALLFKCLNDKCIRENRNKRYTHMVLHFNRLSHIMLSSSYSRMLFAQYCCNIMIKLNTNKLIINNKKYSRYLRFLNEKALHNHYEYAQHLMFREYPIGSCIHDNFNYFRFLHLSMALYYLNINNLQMCITKCNNCSGYPVSQTFLTKLTYAILYEAHRRNKSKYISSYLDLINGITLSESEIAEFSSNINNNVFIIYFNNTKCFPKNLCKKLCLPNYG